MPQTMKSRKNVIETLVNHLPPISLEEMAGVRLMNRTDKKFLTNKATLARLLEMAQGSYYSQETSSGRIAAYRTVYWDVPKNHEMFRTHICGHRPRTKVRVRTYLDSNDTFLEVKKKNNHNKTKKKRVPVPSIEAVMETGVGEEFLRERTGYSFSQLKPTVGNRFNRITLVNNAHTERLTIDFDLQFYNYETGNSAEMDDIVIIELKRDGRVSSPVLAILRELRIKPAGFSKYCIGTAITHPEIRQNKLKLRLRKINKINSKP